MTSHRQKAKQLAKEYIEGGRWRGFFDALYRSAEGDPEKVPWADLVPNQTLRRWAKEHELQTITRKTNPRRAKALVVGCGLGDDAEYLREQGFEVSAFDIAPTAIQWCRRRFPHSPVDYRAADLFELPAEWRRAFDFVFEAYTLQSIPCEELHAAMAALGETVGPGGTLLVLCRARDKEEAAPQIPWPLCREDFTVLTRAGLEEVHFQDYVDEDYARPIRRFKAAYRRPA